MPLIRLSYTKAIEHGIFLDILVSSLHSVWEEVVALVAWVCLA